MLNRFIYISLCAVLFLTLFSCREDKGSERMPLSEIKGLYEPQLNYLNEALESDPDDDELLFKRARVYNNMYRYKEALSDIKAALAVRSNKPEYYLLLSQISFASGNYFESIKAAEKAEGLGLDDPELPVQQAMVYWETGDTLRSRMYIDKVIKVAPFHSGLSLLRGKIAAAKGDTLSAVTALLGSIRNDRYNIDAYRALIKIYLNRGKDDSALYFTTQALRLNSKHPDLYFAQGKLYQKKDLKQSALLSYQFCLKEDSLYAPALLQLGNIFYREGNPAAAYKYYKNYVLLDSDNQTVYWNLITILSAQNREQQAIPYYERLVQLDSNNTALKFKLEKLYKFYSILSNIDTTRVITPTPVAVDTTRRRLVRPVVRRDSVVLNTTTPVVSDTAK